MQNRLEIALRTPEILAAEVVDGIARVGERLDALAADVAKLRAGCAHVHMIRRLDDLLDEIRHLRGHLDQCSRDIALSVSIEPQSADRIVAMVRALTRRAEE